MFFLLRVGLEQCEVWGVKSAVWSVKCEGSSGKWEVWSVKCEVWSVKFKFGVRRAQCEVWSVRFGVWRKQWEVRSVECEVWSVECEVWSLECEECSVQCAVCSVRCGVSREGHGRDRLSLNYRSFIFGKLPPPACPGLSYHIQVDITIYKRYQLKSKFIVKLKTTHHFQARFILISFLHCWIIDVELLIWTNWFPIWSMEY